MNDKEEEQGEGADLGLVELAEQGPHCRARVDAQGVLRNYDENGQEIAILPIDKL
jgi:hypothetical protein